jgi:DNA replication protein DnaC
VSPVTPGIPSPATEADVVGLLRQLKLSTMALQLDETTSRAEANDWTPKAFLGHLAAAEVEARRVRRVERLLKASHLPAGKTLDVLDLKRYTLKTRRQVASVASGDFLDRADNVLLFGLPGRGKSHLAAAVGHELVQRGHKVLFTPTYQLVQRLLIAKRELELEKLLRRLDAFECVILDDIGYVQQERDEIEVLFTFLGERYERRSVIVTSNLVFSKWGRIFKDPMTTACAIERLVHHSTILELTCKKSFRVEEAEKRNKGVDLKTTETATADGSDATELVADLAQDAKAKQKP